MDIKIAKSDLVRVLARVVPAAAQKSPVAAITCVLITADKNGYVSFVATDLVLTITARVQCGVKTPGAIAVPARSMLDIAKSLPAGEAHLAITKGKGKNEAEVLTVKSGKYKGVVPFLLGKDFPSVPTLTAPSLAVESRALAKLIGSVAYAQSTDDTHRAFICCVYLHSKSSSLRCAAYDGTRQLAVSSLDGTFGEFAESINRRAVSDVAKLCAEFEGDVHVSQSGEPSSGHVHFAWDDVTLSVRKLETPFVDYSKFFEMTLKVTVSAPREALVDAVKRVNTTKADGVIFTLSDGELSLHSEADGPCREATDSLDVSYSGSQQRFKLNPDAVTSALAVMHDDEVSVSFADPDKMIFFAGCADPRAVQAVIATMRIEAA